MNGPEKLRWQTVLSDAFTWNDFERLLLGLDDRIDRYIARDNTIEEIILRAITAYEHRGWQNRLLSAALAARPDNEAVVELARQLGATSVPNKLHLETIIRDSNSMLNMGNWLEKAIKIEQAVCRIEIPLNTGGMMFGTGFLVAPDLVITNFHVVSPIAAAEADPLSAGPKASADAVICRFDYREMSDGSRSAGTVYRLAPEWQVLLSPNNRTGQEPAANQLDCAILRLSRPAGSLAVGDHPDGSGSKRGWIKLPERDAPPLAPGSPLLIVQHPQAEPIKLALDSNSVVVVNGAHTRVQYKTNTEPGSSGSPCFDQNWNIAALHHAGDPNFAHNHNEGIPIDTIVSLMKTKRIPV